MKKKRIFGKVSLVLIVVTCLAALASCSAIRDIVASAPNAPVISNYGSVLAWDAVENAEQYNVYADGEKVDTTDKTYYKMAKYSKAVTYSVKAEANGKESTDSNMITVSKTMGFNTNEILEIDLAKQTTATTYSVPADIAYVSLSGTSPVAFSLVILDRSNPLIVHLDNAVYTSTTEKQCITSQTEYAPFATIVEATGTCVLTGGNGETKDAPPVDSNQKGYTGGSGMSAIKLKTVSIEGNGTLSLIGGNGGNGSDGAAAKGMANPGNGGNGGLGGNGFRGEQIVLNMELGGTLNMRGGKGGQGGKAGDNGSIASGIWNNIGSAFGTALQPGKAGADGTGTEAKILQLGGNYNK